MEHLLEKLCSANLTCGNETDLLEEAESFRNQLWLNHRRREFEILERDLAGRQLRIATLQNSPLSYAVQEGGEWVGKGIAFDFINYLQEKYRFKYTVVLPENDILGNNQTGIFGMLYGDKADVAAAFLPVFPKFWNIVRYSTGVDMGEWVVLMKRPLESATGSGLLAPFTLDVWLLILTSLVCVGPIIYLLICLHKKLCSDKPNTTANLYTCIWFVYGALLKQGSTIVAITDSSRMLFATWWIFITVLTAFYTANLTAFLTLSQFTLPVGQTSDIGNKHYSWVTKRGNAIEEAANNELEALSSSLKGSTSQYVDDGSDTILQDYVRRRDYLYLGEKPIVEHMMFRDYLQKTKNGIAESERCTFIITKWAVLTRARAFAYSKKFPFYRIFDDALGHLVESGIVKYKMRDGLPNTQICPLNLGSTERQLRNTDLLLTYYIVGAGFLISAVIFLLEIAWEAMKRPDFTKKIDQQDQHTHVPPPPYHSLFKAPFQFENGEKKIINGRDYWVIKSHGGESNLIPMRTPSALLFQYTH